MQRSQSFLLQHFSTQKLSVGETVLLLEPTFSGKTLGKDDSLPILDVSKALEPHVFKVVPQRSFSIPAEPGTSYFYLQKAQIHLSAPIMVHGSCGGHLCDGQVLRANEKTCGCLFNREHSPFVLSMGVKIFDSAGVREVFLMHDFRSWMLTQMFVPGINFASKLEDFVENNEVVLRRAIREVMIHVNTHGGWDVVGWMRRGVQVDAAEKEKKGGGEEVAADDVSPHIIRLKPTLLSSEALVGMGFRHQGMHVE